MDRRTFVSTVGAGALASQIARASSAEIVTTQTGKWRDWSEDDLAYAHDFAPDTAERKAFLANLTALCEPLRKNPAWSSPMGFEVAPQRGIRGDFREKPPHPIPGSLMIQTFWYYRSKPGAQAEVGGESPCTLFVNVNSLHTIMGAVVPNCGGDLFFAPKKSETTLPYLRLSTGWVVTKRTAPPWVVATQERVATAWRDNARKELDKAKGNKFAQKELDEREAFLAKLSAAEKSAPAFSQTTGKSLAKESDSGALAVIAPNPDFFDPKLPRSALQVAVVKNIAHGAPGSEDDPVKALRTLIFKKADYPALEKVLS